MASSSKIISTLFDNFKSGDLIYGLEAERAKVRDQLERKAGYKSYDGKEFGVPITIDKMNTVIHLLGIETKGTYQYEPGKKMPVFEWLLGKSKVRPIELGDRVSRFHYLKHFLIITCSFGRIGTLQTTVDYNNRKNFNPRTMRIMYACKVATTRYHTHFLLDGLQFQHTFDENFSLSHKNYKTEGRGCYYDSHTSSELRFVLRHYDIVSKRMKFYTQSNSIDNEVKAVMKPDSDFETEKYKYMASGKSIVEVDVMTHLARFDLKFLAENKDHKEGPISRWMKKENEYKRLADTTLKLYQQKLSESSHQFIASPSKPKPAPKKDELDLIEIPDELALPTNTPLS